MEDEKLIMLVQERPALYDKRNKMHHNRDYIIKQWISIAEEMQSDGKFFLVCFYLYMLFFVTETSLPRESYYWYSHS